MCFCGRCGSLSKTLGSCRCFLNKENAPSSCFLRIVRSHLAGCGFHASEEIYSSRSEGGAIMGNHSIVALNPKRTAKTSQFALEKLRGSLTGSRIVFQFHHFSGAFAVELWKCKWLELITLGDCHLRCLNTKPPAFHQGPIDEG